MSIHVPHIVTSDGYSREIRFEFCDRRNRDGGVYDLPTAVQEAMLLPGYLPQWGDFLPDFVIVLGLGAPAIDGGVAWQDLRVHVGGIQWSALCDGYTPGASYPEPLASCEWHSIEALLRGGYGKTPAPRWVVDLIRNHTPWGSLIDSASGDAS